MNQVTLDLPLATEVERSIGVPAYSVHLDAVRGCAALVVFLTHLRYIFLGASGSSVAATALASAAVHPLQHHPGSMDMGHKAVMIFFVLSGYFVGGSVLRSFREGQWSWMHYLVSRLTRLWIVLLPALLLGLLLDTAGSRFFPHSIYEGPSGQFILAPALSTRMGLETFFGNVFFLQTILVKQFGTNVALWSLANEFWYYLAFPLLVLAVLAERSVGQRVLSAVLFVALFVFVGAKIAPYFLIWLLGAAVGLLPLRLSRKLQPVLLGVALALLGVACFALRYREDASPFLVDLAIGVLFCVVLYCLLHRRDAAEATTYRKGVHLLSKMSYSLYLVNLPLLFFASGLLMSPWHRWTNSFFHLLLAVGVACAVFAVAYLFYLGFEAHTDKVRRWLLE